MDETTNNDGTGAWVLSKLGQAIDVYVDRQLNSPQIVQPTSGYGIDQNGQLYQVGQPTTVQTVSPVPGGGNMGFLLLVGLILLVARHGK